jgi:class 3 adenylate cyclase
MSGASTTDSTSRSGRLNRSVRSAFARPGLSIQSKLLIMLLSVSIGSTLVVGAIGYISGTDSLKQAAFDQLVNVRESRTQAMQQLADTIENNIVLESKNATGVQAVQEFTAAFDSLDQLPAPEAQSKTVSDYYGDKFIPDYEKATGTQSEAAAFVPTGNAETYLQNFYTVPPADFDAAAAVDDAGDGSTWSAVNAKYNPYYRDMVTRYDYEDALLLDTKGNVVYSVYKGVDLGTNILNGPYQGSILHQAYTDVLNSNSIDTVQITDFDRYQPSLGVPTAWGLTPIGGADGKIAGVLAVQLPITSINNVMTGNGKWEQQGLGDTGETYLVGPDRMMRSVSRELLQHPDSYSADAIEGGLSPSTAKRVVDVKGTVQLQTVNTKAVDDGLEGKTGTTVEQGYLGKETLTAYAPLTVGGLQWVIIASVDSSEAFAPVADFARNLVLAIVVLLVIVSLLSLLLAQVFAKPVRTLVTAVRRVAGGDLGVEVAANTRDEFGDLSVAFNDMSRSLQVKQALIDQQKAESDKLLLSLMPETVARRYREGEETIAEDHQDVSVVYADIIGFDDFANGLGAAKELSLLNDLMRSFDDAAERIGIEKVRTLREGYLASCGLIVPRVDSVRRTVEFAVEMSHIVERFNAQHGANVSLRAGVDTGTVTSGLVGRSSIAYDMWGDAVNIANRVQSLVGAPGIFISQRVRDKLPESPNLTEVGTIETKDGPQAVWQVS